MTVPARRVTAAMVAVAAMVALAAALAGGAFAGPAAETSAAKSATIGMKMVDGKPAFVAPRKVGEGQVLKVINRTDPQRIGPHTLTLIKQGLKPRQVDGQLFKAHRVRPVPLPPEVCEEEDIPEDECFDFDVRKPVVDNGKKGWDRSFTRKRQGDSWYTETKGERHSRKVRAKAGETLHFFCAIHPFMKGKVKVTS